MEQVQVSFAVSDRVPELLRRLDALPQHARTCRIHGEQVTIGPGSTFTFGIATKPPWEVCFGGCCREAIDQVRRALSYF